MTSHIVDKKEIEQLYLSGKSMSEIAISLNCSVHKISYWMNKYNIKRRSWSDATYVKLNPNGDPFKIKEVLTTEEVYLKGLALGLYWGEGDKNSPTAVRVTNTDPGVILIFIEFLLKICQLWSRKLSYSIVCFNDTDPRVVREYWAHILQINPIKFGKIVQIPPQGKGSYKKKSQFGVCSVTVSNPKLKKWIMEEIAKVKFASIV